tara:strand:+ start:18006 stop:18908 length:903 start_codon:yes stop_codon:yes gene_type:complete
MSVSHKYRTFDELLESVKVDFNTYNLEGMIEPQQLIKVAIRVNYDLGLRINRTNSAVVDIENNKGQLPSDFQTLNFAAICGKYRINTTTPSGTTTETHPTTYTPEPGFTAPCEDGQTCKDVCVVKPCKDDSSKDYIVVQRVGENTYREFNTFIPLRIADTSGAYCTTECPNLGVSAVDFAELKDGFILTNFKSGKIFLNYQATLEDEGGNLLTLDHPYCNEYYEYALKSRILENMIFAGENVVNQSQLIEQRLRAARNNALGFVNTPNFEEYRKIWEVNRQAQYNKYYDMFSSFATNRRC